MKRVLIILLLSCACNLQAQDNLITTIAGQPVTSSGWGGYSGDGGLAINAKLSLPSGICLDKWNNLYIADAFNNRVRKIDLNTGIITTVAGNSTPGGPGAFSGDNGPATNSQLWIPEAVFTDTAGNVYIADGLNNRIRKITVATGTITTVAGNGTAGYMGDNEQATNAELNGPVGLCLDKAGNIYIGDYNNNVVRKVDAITGIITTIAGDTIAGYTGDSGPATNAEIDGPCQLFADNTGNIFIADQWNHAIRRVDATTGIITTIAGNGTPGYTGDNGPAINALLNQPTGIFIDAQNNIFIAQYQDEAIRRIDAVTGIITTVAGTGIGGYSGDGGPATNAKLTCSDVCLDNYGTMYISDYDSDRIRKVYNPTLGFANVKMSQCENVEIYPNPATGNFTVEHAKGLMLTIYDVVGKEVFTTSIVSDKQNININDFSDGVYLVEFVDPLTAYRITKRLVIAQ